MGFIVELEYEEGTPADERKDLYDISVPALPPPGTRIRLGGEYFDGGRNLRPCYFEVEVVGIPELFAEDPAREAEYLVKVRPTS